MRHLDRFKTSYHGDGSIQKHAVPTNASRPGRKSALLKAVLGAPVRGSVARLIGTHMDRETLLGTPGTRRQSSYRQAFEFAPGSHAREITFRPRRAQPGLNLKQDSLIAWRHATNASLSRAGSV